MNPSRAEYPSHIPAHAREQVTTRHPVGEAAEVEYRLAGQVVGRRRWHPDGYLEQETPLRDGLRHGVEYTWYAPGHPALAEPYENGLAHGTAQQRTPGGRLVGTYTMTRGSGLDLWQDRRGDGSYYLAEARAIQDGLPHGFEWWLNEDGRTLWAERCWKHGRLHGIERQWTPDGHLQTGYPRYYLDGVKISDLRYRQACQADPSLPLHRPQDDRPGRILPPEIRSAINT